MTTATKPANIQWHEGLLKLEERWEWLRCRGGTLWLTGLPASGKSTVASNLERALVLQGRHAFRLDGDNVRHGLNKDLGFTREHRAENIRRIGEVAKLLAESGCISITAFISPYISDRDRVRKMHLEANLPFLEVFVDAPLEVCEQRDPKGLYQRARAGKLEGLTGIDDPYEAPPDPELVLHTAERGVKQCVRSCLALLVEHRMVTATDAAAIAAQ